MLPFQLVDHSCLARLLLGTKSPQPRVLVKRCAEGSAAAVDPRLRTTPSSISRCQFQTSSSSWKSHNDDRSLQGSALGYDRLRLRRPRWIEMDIQDVGDRLSGASVDSLGGAHDCFISLPIYTSAYQVPFVEQRGRDEGVYMVIVYSQE